MPNLPPSNNTQPAIQLVGAQNSSLALIATLVVTSLTGGESQDMSAGPGTASVAPTQATAPSGKGGEGAHAADESGNPQGSLSLLIPTALRPWVMVLLGTNEALAGIRERHPRSVHLRRRPAGPRGVAEPGLSSRTSEHRRGHPRHGPGGAYPFASRPNRGPGHRRTCRLPGQEEPAQPEPDPSAVPVAAGPATDPAEVLPDTSKSTRFRLVNLLAVTVASIGALTFTRDS